MPGRDVAALYLEHNAPDGDVPRGKEAVDVVQARRVQHRREARQDRVKQVEEQEHGEEKHFCGDEEKSICWNLAPKEEKVKKTKTVAVKKAEVAEEKPKAAAKKPASKSRAKAKATE